MNKEQQRIAIAEACGWTTLPMPAGCPDAWEHKDTGDTAINEMYLPDYLNDLNAMRHAENYCLHNLLLWATYRHLLLLITSDGSGVPESATAAQRAEAFLKTLNLWEN